MDITNQPTQPASLDALDLRYWQELRAFRMAAEGTLERLKLQITDAETAVQANVTAEQTFIGYLQRKHKDATAINPQTGALQYPEPPEDAASTGTLAEVEPATPTEPPAEPTEPTAEAGANAH